MNDPAGLEQPFSPGQPCNPEAPPVSTTTSASVGSTLFFARVPPKAPDSVLHALFSTYGTVKELIVFKRWATARTSKGCGIVTFASTQAAQAALAGLNGIYKFSEVEGATKDLAMVLEWADTSRLNSKLPEAACAGRQTTPDTHANSRQVLQGPATLHPYGNSSTAGSCGSNGWQPDMQLGRIDHCRIQSSHQQQSISVSNAIMLQQTDKQSIITAGFSPNVVGAARLNPDAAGVTPGVPSSGLGGHCKLDTLVPLHLLDQLLVNGITANSGGLIAGHDDLLLQLQLQQHQQQQLLPPSLGTTWSADCLVSNTMCLAGSAAACCAIPLGVTSSDALQLQLQRLPATGSPALTSSVLGDCGPIRAAAPMTAVAEYSQAAADNADSQVQLLPLTGPWILSHGERQLQSGLQPWLFDAAGAPLVQAGTSAQGNVGFVSSSTSGAPTAGAFADQQAAFPCAGSAYLSENAGTSCSSVLQHGTAATVDSQPVYAGTAASSSSDDQVLLLSSLMSLSGGASAQQQAAFRNAMFGGQLQSVSALGPQTPLGPPVGVSSAGRFRVNGSSAAAGSIHALAGASSSSVSQAPQQQGPGYEQVDLSCTKVVVEVAAGVDGLGYIAQQVPLVASLSGAEVQLSAGPSGVRLCLWGTAVQVETARSLLVNGRM